LLLSLLLWCVWSIHSITKSQSFQNEAERWQGPTEQRYCQVAAFLDKGGLPARQADALESELKEAFPTQEIEPPIVTAFGTWKTGFAEYGHRKTDAELWQVSENFFLLHSFPMVSGGAGTFGEQNDAAVLNEAAAFALFGSSDCVGEAVRIGSLGWRVIAVVREPEGAVNKAAFAGIPRIWLPIQGDSDVTFYEAILPEYYSGFAAQMLERAAGTPVTTSTGRFRLPRLWEKAKDFFRTPPGKTPPLPPWEQSARLAERKLCLDWSIALFATICLLVQLVPLVVNGIKKGVNKFRALRHGRGQIVHN
jgi:hypothetical protein